MAEPKDKKPQALGCLIAVVAGLALVIGGGLYLGQRDQAESTPCERYAQVYTVELDNCHSGVTGNRAHHEAICEREVNPSDACIARIEQMTCDELEAGPARVAPQVCGRQR